MQWRGRRESDNIEDRRGGSRAGVAVGGGLGTIVLIVVALLLGVDPRALFVQKPGNRVADGPGVQRTNPQEEELKKFVSVVLADTEDVWNDQFRQVGRQYKEPRLILFSGQVNSACGRATSSVGPFYCPGDDNVYIDLSFYEDLKNRHGAPGDFAQAYVIAHEVGHHIQNLLGTSAKVDAMRSKLSEAEYNKLSVRLELQADFLAGVWAHHAQRTKKVLEPGDIEEALNAASAIGDDRLQKEAQGYVVPDSFTHGTSAQRVRWFKKGFDTGDIKQGDTFNAKQL